MSDTAPLWRDMDGAARAAAYSPSSALDGPLDPYIQRYIDESRAAYETLQPRTLPYGHTPEQTLDFVRPQGGATVPLHVFIHGGYWQELSKRASFFAAPHALASGYAFAALDYTLAPAAGIGEMVAECIQAVRLLRRQSGALGIDPERIVISGSSAGAHLAAMTALGLPRQEAPSGLLLISGIYELEPLIGTYINDALGLNAHQARGLSPMGADLSAFPASAIVWGAQETGEFKRQSQHFAAQLRAAGRQVAASEIAHRNHFDIVHDFAPDAPLGSSLLRLIQADH